MQLSITAEELAEKMRKKQDFILIDVREGWERRLCHIEGDMHMQMARIPAEAKKLPRDRQIILYCHSGNRSMHAAIFLKEMGFDALSLKGGIDEWAEQIDRKMKRY